MKVQANGVGTMPDTLDLETNVLHIWRANLAVCRLFLQRFATTLSEDESQRADQYRFSSDRERFVICRGILRDILHRYIGNDPQATIFKYGPWGKPELQAERGSLPIMFNLSHAADWALFAVTLGHAVGIDLEQICAPRTTEDIAQYVLTPEELIELHNVPDDLQTTAFTRYWVRKEAYVKAIGKGMSVPFTSFSAPGSLTGVPVVIEEQGNVARRMAIYELQPAIGYVGAVAVEGVGYTTYYQSWTPIHSIPCTRGPV